MENVSAIVIKRLLITWAIITIITCVRVKTKVTPKQQPHTGFVDLPTQCQRKDNSDEDRIDFFREALNFLNVS